VLGGVFNLIAASLCTIGTGIGTVALFMLDPTFVNILAAVGGAIATLGGMAWLIAAVIDLRGP
jgi:hypothetical protein